MTKILFLFLILLIVISSGCTNPSGGSVVAFNHTPLLEPPAAFQFTQVQASNGNVEIVWQVSTRADNYEFFIGTSSSEITTPVPECSGNKESCQITGLDPGTIYYLDIKATNAAGSKKVTSTRSVLSVGSFNITSSSVGDKIINLAWENSNNATSYNLLYGTSSNYYPNTITNVTSPYVLSGLTNGLRYYVRIVAVNSSSGSASSNNEINHQPFGPLAAPTGLALTAAPGQIALDWNDLSGATSYKVYRGTTTGSLTELASGITSSNYTDSTTTDGTTYFYALKAFNGFDSILSSEQSARSISAFNITSAVTGPAPTQVTLNWPATTGASTYEVRYGTNSGALNLTLPNVTSPLIMTGLTGGVPYYFKVVAKNAIGNGTNQYSTNQLAATPVAAIAAPTGLVASATPSSVTLTWNAVSGTTSYKVYRGLSAGSLSLLDASVATNSYTDPTVANGTTYYYAVRSFNGLDSVDSSQVSIRPISSLSLTVAAVATFSSANLTWGSATGAATYDIRYGTSPGIYTNISLNRSSPFVLTGLSASTTYFIAIRANNTIGTGTSVLSNEMSLTTTSQFPTISILSYPAIDSSNKTAYTVSGACSENTRTVTVNVGGVTSTPTCTALAWTATLNVSAVADSASVSITATHANSGGNSSNDSRTVVKDATNPIVAITSSPAINNVNKAAYVVSGTCNENTRIVSVVVGGITATPTCTSSAWTASLNVSALSDSLSVAITADLTDAAGNSAPQATTNIVKDTSNPSVAISYSPLVNNANKTAYTVSGTCSETGRNVTVNVGSTNTLTLCSLLTWSATLNVSGNPDSTTLLVTADHTDATGNTAVQAGTTVLKDTDLPTVAITSSPMINFANKSAYVVSGTCSENSRPVSVNVGGVTSTPTCTNVAWSATLNVTAIADGTSVSITANHTDAVGNSAIQASTTVVKDTSLSTVAITASPTINNSNKAAYTVSGTCSENSRSVSISVGGVTSTPTCTTLAWSATLDVTAVADSASVTITADHADASGNSATQATTNVLKDTVIPTVAITSSTLINNANKAAYIISGTCSENSRSVSISVGGVTSTPTCTTLAWSTTLNVTAVSDGASVSITANHSDAAGNTATQASTTVVKDTSNPNVAITSSPVINIANKATYVVSGTCSENSRVVSVNVGGVTATPTCTTLVWSTTLDATIVSDSASVTITANHSDVSGNSAVQASITVLKDTALPTVAITSSPVINNANKAAYVVSGTCSENSRTVSINVGGVTATPACTASAWSATVNVTAVADDPSVVITADHTDEAGNSATQASATVVKDTAIPTVGITSSLAINNSNNTAYPVSGTCSENSRTVSVSVGGVTATPTCTTLTWSATLNVSGVADAASVTITANHTDAATNSATQASTTVVKNTGLPTVAITSSPAINNANKTAYVISGTCSENTRIVSINVGGVTATPICTTLTWSATLNVAAVADGASISITADHNNSVGSNATQAATTVLKDTVIPIVAITSSPLINNANKAAYLVSGTCSDNTRVVSVNVGGVTATPTCTTLTWSATLNVTAVADGASVSITANHTDAAANSAIQASTTVVKDAALPTVAITTSPTINIANKAAYAISGTCSENTQTVLINVGGVTSTPTCSGLTWSATLNVTAIADGSSVAITANHDDTVGNSATMASTTVLKDTVPPTVAITSSPAINNTNKAAYPVAGTCSENTITVSVNVGGVSANPTCTTLTWSTSLNVSAVSDGASVSVSANHTDAGANNASQASSTVVKDTTLPTVAITSSPAINNANKAAYVVSGTCSENTRTVSVSVGGVTATPTCTTLTWTATLNVTAVADGSSIAITANHSDAASNAATQASTSVVKDATAPTVAITSSPIINNANKAAYPISGTCSENTRTVSIDVGGVTATPTCTTLTWSSTLNLTSVTDSASVSATANHTDVSGNAATQASTSIIKDTVIPTIAITSSPAINNVNKNAYSVSGTCSENSRTVSVNVGGVTGTPTCSALAWSTTLNVSGIADGPAKTITANHTDSAGNTAAQASTTVVKDVSNPTVAITSSPVISNSNKTAYTVSGTCSETGQTVVINVGSVNTSDTCTLLTWTVTVDVSGNPDSSTFLITADHTDVNGNTALQAGITVTKDTAVPTVAITSAPIINNANKAAYTVSGTCSENTRAISVNIGGIAATPACSSLTWTTGAINVTAAVDSPTLTITANHTDSAGNAAIQAATTVIKDTSNPTVAITSAPGINDSNKTAYTVSGTCSENMRTVAVNIGGVAATPACTSLTWTTGALNVSAVADSATVSITANHTDSNGNSASQASTTVVKDSAFPTVALSSTEPATTSGASWVVRATFNEAVTGMAITDFVVGNGSASGFTAVSTTLYDITVTPAGAGLVTVNLASNSATDAAGNGNTAATQLSRTHVTPAVLTFAVTSTHDFGSVNVGGSAEVTVIINKSGMANATSISEIGLAAPFTFKGGAFPGTGGTCTSTITAACSIVLLYTPTAAAVHNDTVQIQYNNGAILQSVSRNLTGTGVVIVPTHTSISGPTGIMINQCIPYTINTVTSAGVNGNVSANQTINLVVNNGTGTFYSNNTCTTTATSTIVTAGTSSKIVYFKSTTTAQSLTLVFNPSSLVSSTHDVTTASTPVAISFTTPVEMQTNDCNPIVVNLVDANGTAVGKSTSVQVNLAQNGAATFYSDSNCLGVVTSVTYAAYDTSKTIYVKDSTQQTVNINLTDNAALLTAKNANINFVNALVWWDNNYLKRIPIILNNKDQATAFTNLPIMIKLNASRISYSDILAGGADIRFTLDDHTTALKYEIESWNSSGDSFVWVKIPSIAASADKIIYMYYNNSGASDGQDATNTWTGFSGVWNMKKSGANYIDSTGSGKTGVAQGTVTDLTGPSANAISVNGSSSLDVSYDLSQIIGRTSTLSFWIKTTQTGNNTNYLAPGITGVEQAGGGNDIFFGWISASGFIRIGAGNGASATSNFVVNDSSWRHVTMSRNETSGAVKFYINGVLNGTGTSETGAKTTAFSKFGVIGDTGGSPTFFVGSMDGIRLKATVETDARIKAEYKFGTESNVTYGSIENF